MTVSKHSEGRNRVFGLTESSLRGPNSPTSTFYRACRRFVWRHPSLYKCINNLRRRIPMNVEDYDLLIEGYPRSANTWTSMYWEVTQPHLRILHHCHVPPPVIQAVRLKKPVILLIREPFEAALSYAYLRGNENIVRKLQYYIDYHRTLWPVASSLNIVPFEKTVDSPDAIVKQLAGRLPVTLDVTTLSQDSLNEASRRVRTLSTVQDRVDERYLGLPCEPRRVWKQAKKEELQDVSRSALAEEAISLFRVFRAQAL